MNKASFYLDKAGDCSQHFFSEGDCGSDNALHLAAESGNLDLVKYLAGKENADINKSKSYKVKPLHIYLFLQAT
ncbi:ankyrin repeat domain-containing protein [Wolbachia endosymbiont of Mansonella ozzardi]|uniref:ankyrin repeat domain-containing protein n=1 Tax=Wolbachia endosymbiont of Mansonella ozzardi TaxID=137464 RepID=UPI0034CD837F|nr:ankyrin repeat domain-containing protein [Wolbachia endosymbiont of Mansonella ozzardi]